jgi:hypothetical protein
VHTSNKRDRVHELTDVPPPSSGTPQPLILANERTLVVTYVTAKPSTGQADGSGLPSADKATAIVVFQQCFASHFGPPNDQAFASHPLAVGGLPPCCAFEVESSTWLRGLEMRNQGHPRHDPQLFQQLRHWVWTFQDSVLECGAVSYAALEAQGRPEDLLPRMQVLLRSS